MNQVNLAPMKEIFQGLKMFPQFLEEVKERERSVIAGINCYIDWVESTFQAIESGKTIVFNQFTFFPELLFAFDLYPLCPEAWSAIPLYADPMGGTEPIDIAENAGVHPELCSSFKFNIGEAIRGRLPIPNLIVATSSPCDSARTSYQALAKVTGAPMFFVDEGYWDTEEDLTYIESEIRGLISFIETEITHKKLDYDRLKEVLEESNKAVEYFLEANELRRLTPCPESGKTFTYSFMAFMTSAGLPRCTALQKEILDETRERARSGKGAIPEEKLRCIWFYTPIVWDYFLINWLEDEWKMVIPMTMDGYYVAKPIDTSSPEAMIRGIAERLQGSIPMGRQGRGTADIWIDDMLRVYGEYHGDCIILGGHYGCKWLKAACGLVRETCREMGIPLYMFDVDIFDPRVVSAETYRQQISDFLTTVMSPGTG